MMNEKKKGARNVRRHPDAVAWDAFEECNRDLFELSALGCASGDAQYLRNRLWTAFMAGIKVGRESK